MSWFNRKSKEETGAMASSGTRPNETATDPVCGMLVNTSSAAATSQWQGKTYYFCAAGCKRAFDKEPIKYTQAQGSSGHGHDCCG